MRLPILQITVDTRRLTSFALIAFILGGALGGVLYNYGGVYVPTSDLSNMFGYMKQFQSYDELKDYLDKQGSSEIYWGMPFFRRGLGSDVLMLESAPISDNAFPPPSDGGTAKDYSQTNIQVDGVDEADIVKTDGEYIYFARGSEVVIVKAYPVSEATVVSKINLTRNVHDLYVASDRLIVFTAQYPNYNLYYEFDTQIHNEYRSILNIYDVSDRTSPEEVR